MEVCTDCGEEKPIAYVEGPHSICRECFLDWIGMPTQVR